MQVIFFRIRPSIYGSIRRFVSIIPYYMYPKMGYIPLSVERHRAFGVAFPTAYHNVKADARFFQFV